MEAKVWLKAESSIRYPVAFNDNDEERIVEITGEAYFEVVNSALELRPVECKRRFIVSKGNMRVVVVFGTKFNVNTF